ncbi:MAG: hypothetical protein KHY89_11080 [Butyricicoccus pullicaecorum]|nr:hypothetical protein [Butyricicoccus pullicaecorum]
MRERYREMPHFMGMYARRTAGACSHCPQQTCSAVPHSAAHPWHAFSMKARLCACAASLLGVVPVWLPWFALGIRRIRIGTSPQTGEI